MPLLLSTRRLLLKPNKVEDFDNLLALRSNPDVTKYTISGVQTHAEVKDFLEKLMAYQAKHRFGLIVKAFVMPFIKPNALKK